MNLPAINAAVAVDFANCKSVLEFESNVLTLKRSFIFS